MRVELRIDLISIEGWGELVSVIGGRRRSSSNCSSTSVVALVAVVLIVPARPRSPSQRDTAKCRTTSTHHTHNAPPSVGSTAIPRSQPPPSMLVDTHSVGRRSG